MHLNTNDVQGLGVWLKLDYDPCNTSRTSSPFRAIHPDRLVRPTVTRMRRRADALPCQLHGPNRRHLLLMSNNLAVRLRLQNGRRVSDPKPKNPTSRDPAPQNWPFIALSHGGLRARRR